MEHLKQKEWTTYINIDLKTWKKCKFFLQRTTTKGTLSKKIYGIIWEFFPILNSKNFRKL